MALLPTSSAIRNTLCGALCTALLLLTPAAGAAPSPLCEKLNRVLKELRQVCGDTACTVNDVASRLNRDQLVSMANAGEALQQAHVFYQFAASAYDSQSITNYEETELALVKIVDAAKRTRADVLVMARASQVGGDDHRNTERSRQRALGLGERLIALGLPHGQLKLAYVGADPRLRLSLRDMPQIPKAALIGHSQPEEALNQSAMILVDRCGAPERPACVARIAASGPGHAPASRVVLSGEAMADQLFAGWIEARLQMGHPVSDSELTSLQAVVYELNLVTKTTTRRLISAPAWSNWSPITQGTSLEGAWAKKLSGIRATTAPVASAEDDAEADVICTVPSTTPTGASNNTLFAALGVAIMLTAVGAGAYLRGVRA